MNSKLYGEVYPLTHIFYPLQNYTKDDEDFVQGFFNALSVKKPVKTENLIYVHIPFCLHHCLYCPFHSTGRNLDLMKRYTEAVVRELEMVSKFKYLRDINIDAVYFGGGSPSVMPIENTKRIIDSIHNCFNVSENCEWSFEGNPTTLANDELMHFLKEQNISRISFGIQTFDQEMRDRLEIVATLDDVEKCVEMAKKYQFADINADMIYYLPGQSVEDLKTDIAHVHRLGLTSIDYYYLSYFGLPERVIKGMDDGSFPAKPSEETRYQMYECVDSLIDLGYNKTLEDQFSKQETTSKFYKLLWGGGYGEYNAETIAIGCSARGYIDGYSYANTKSPHDYTKEVMNREVPIFKVSDRLKEKENRGIVFSLKFLKIPTNKITGTRYFELFTKFIDDGLMYESNGYYHVTTKGAFYNPNIAIDLFEKSQLDVTDKWLENYETHYNNKTCP